MDRAWDFVVGAVRAAAVFAFVLGVFYVALKVAG